MTDAKVTTIAGHGFTRSGFGGPAAGLDLSQATPGTRELGRNHGIAVGPHGAIYVASTITNTIGRIAPVATWRTRPLGDALTSPTGALPWIPYPSTVSATVDATTVDGRSAVHWVATDADRQSRIYFKIPVIPGAHAHASISVFGSGEVCLELYDSGGDTFGPIVTLTGSPQVLTLDKELRDEQVQIQVRSLSNQARVEVTAFAASIAMSELTGDTTLVAGRPNSAGDNGDGGPATQARLNAPGGIAVDRTGRVVVADTYNNRIRAVSPRGVIETIAGTGVPGFDGDGKATRSRVNHPGGVAIDQTGAVYVADTYNNRVRRIDRRGRIATIAGTGVAGYRGDGGPAKAAELNHPQAVAVDPTGAVYIADTYNNRIRRIDRHGRIATVAGTGEPGYAGDGGPAAAARLATPRAVTFGPDGSMYIADTLNQRIRRISAGVIETVVGTGSFGRAGRTGGPPTSAQLYEPLGVAVDPATGDLFIVEGSQAVLRVAGLAPAAPHQVR